MSTITVETRTEQTRRVLIPSAQGWEFSIWENMPDGEPRIRDIDAATRLGYSRPRDVRKVIERIWPEDKRPSCRDTVARQPVGPGGKGTRTYTVTEYWLTEAELLKLIARSETPVAEAILDEMIAVYMAVRRHIVATVPVKAHERKLPEPKAPAGFIDRAAPPSLPPLSQRLGSATRIRNGVQYWDVVVEMSGQEVALLREMAGKRQTEEVASQALAAWIINASAMGVLRLHAGR